MSGRRIAVIAENGPGLPVARRTDPDATSSVGNTETCGKTQTTHDFAPAMIQVRGNPAPKGSNRAILRAGRAVLVPGSSNTGKLKLVSWSAAVRAAAIGAARAPIVDCEVAVAITFRLTRPRAHRNARGELRSGAPRRPAVKPDLDKLLRSTLDALTGVAFDDDARVVQVSAAKIYAEPGDEGAAIAWWPVAR